MGASFNMARAVPIALGLYTNQFIELVGTAPILETYTAYDLYRISTYTKKVEESIEMNYKTFPIVGEFKIRELSGCCGVVVFYHATIMKPYRGRGIGKLFLQIRERAAILAGYTVAQATVLANNEVQVHILRDAGWEEKYTFKNRRTKNEVIAFAKYLNKEK